MSNHALLFRLLATIPVICLLGTPVHAATWWDLRGVIQIEAEMLGLWGDQVILQKGDGTRIAVALSSLRADSRIQAEDLNKGLVKQRSVRVAELEGIAAEADAPAPTPLPTPPPAPAYQAPKAEMDIVDLFGLLNDQTQAGHMLVVYYDALPPSYRTQVDELFKLGVAKIDASNLESFAKSLHDVGDLILGRQNWIFSHPRVMALPDTSRDRLREVTLAMSGLLRDGFNPENVSVAKMNQMTCRQWLAEQDKVLAPYLAQLCAGSLFQATLDGVEKDVARVTIAYSGKTQKQSYTRVEGFWVPSGMAKNWTDDVAKAKASLEAMSNGEVLSGGIMSMLGGAFQPLMAPLREAGDAAEFHIAMEAMLRNTQPIAEMVASTMPGLSQLGQSNAPGYGSESYGSSYDSSMQGYPSSPEGYGPPSSSGPPTTTMGNAEEMRRRAEEQSRNTAAGAGP